MTIWCGGMLLNITMAAHPIAVAVTPIMTVGPWCRRKSLAGMQPYVSLPRSQDTSYIHRTAGQLAVHTAVAVRSPWTEAARSPCQITSLDLSGPRGALQSLCQLRRVGPGNFTPSLSQIRT